MIANVSAETVHECSFDELSEEAAGTSEGPSGAVKGLWGLTGGRTMAYQSPEYEALEPSLPFAFGRTFEAYVGGMKLRPQGEKLAHSTTQLLCLLQRDENAVIRKLLSPLA